jgi:molecular chaperone DnaJ
VTGGSTHYDTLGVRADASYAEIRAAYRRLARASHPDTGAAADATSLAAANDAWRTLADPARRAAYDRRLNSASRPAIVDSPPPAAPRTAPRFDPLARYSDPPRFPWRVMAVMAVLGLVALAIGVVFRRDPEPRPVDNILGPGACVTVEPDGDAAEVQCDQPHDGVVQRLVAFDESCPALEQPHRDRQGMGIACVIPT